MGPPKRHFAQRGEPETEKEPTKRMKTGTGSMPAGAGTLTLEAQLMAELAQANALLAKEKQGKATSSTVNGAGDASQPKPKSSMPSARAIKMDSAGNLVDEEGNVLEAASSSSSSSSSKKKDYAATAAGKGNKDKEMKEVESNPYLAHMGSGPSKGKGRGAMGARKPSKGLNFFKPGEYAISAAAAATVKTASSARPESSTSSSFVGSKSGLSLVPRATTAGGSGSSGSSTGSGVLRLEWWDKQYLPKDRQRGAKKDGDYVADEGCLQLSNCVSHKYVEHPAPLPSLSRLKEEQTLPMYLTKQERTRIRKKKRAEAEQERRDKEAMGLVPPREPKLKLSNFMRVLGEKAVLDPSKMEMGVLQQIYQRQATHELNNAKNKLTSEQRKEKTWLKRQERETTSTAESLHVAVFCVGNVGDLGTQIKVLRNAKEWFLTGALVKCQEEGVGRDLVIVEGGPRGIRKFSRMMLDRIKWGKVATTSSSSSSSAAAAAQKEESGSGGGGGGEGGAEDKEGDGKELVTMDVQSDSDSDSDSDDSNGTNEDSGNRCTLLWKGLASKRAFSRFQLHETRTSAGARHWFDNHHVGHFWHHAQDHALL